MREIKFRVWDIDGAQMSEGFNFESVVSGDEDIAFPLRDETLPWKDFMFFRKEYSDYMQFTGLKDKNVKEIYEGDIVNYVTGSDNKRVNCLIEYGEYQTYTQIIVKGKEEENSGEPEVHYGFYLLDKKNKIPLGSLWIEVIGNIYETPDLITKP